MSQARTVVLLGHPNTGKSSLFNHLTGLSAQVVNYPGSTVEGKLGQLKQDASIHILDTPGVVSLVPRTRDESVAIESLYSPDACSDELASSPDLVMVVVDGTQLKRHLVLVRQIQQAGFPVAMVVSMSDVLKRQGDSINCANLSKTLDVPVFILNNREGDGVTCIVDYLQSIPAIAAMSVDQPQGPFEPHESIESSFAWANDIVAACVSQETVQKASFDWDRILLNPLGGPLVFLGVMSVFFWSIFALATPFIDAVDTGFVALIELLKTVLPSGWGARFLTEGVLAGIGAFMVFVPQIALLFLGLTVMESSGYLARGAVLVDRPLSAIGLSGRCFVPLLSGCACSIPAMMAARTIPGYRQRMLTLFVIPLMTCTARLPVYGLLLALLIPGNPVTQGMAMTGVYLLSMVLASLVAAVAGRFFFLEKTPDYFHIELPSWRRPLIGNILKTTQDQTVRFIKNAGPIITLVSIVLWFGSVWPSEEAPLVHLFGQWLTPLLEPMGVDWRVGVALIAAFAAREVFVSALVVIFAVGDESLSSLVTHLSSATFEGSSQLIFTPGSIVGLLLFFMVALQCMSTVAVAKKEMGGWQWPMVMTGGYLILAYSLAVVANTIL